MTEPRGWRNNNPGNVVISSAKWVGKVEFNSDGKFEQFDTNDKRLYQRDIDQTFP
jgi:hypothetical protein